MHTDTQQPIKRKKGMPMAILPYDHYYFPQDVLTDILTRLPVRSVLKFKCVCKFWHAVIDNNDFISLHFNRHNKRNHQSCDENYFHISTLERPAPLGFSGFDFTARRSDTLKPSSSSMRITQAYRAEASIDGLILLRYYTYGSHQLRLWNPSIRKMLLLPPPPLSSYCSLYAVGYSPSSNDYKVVVFQSYVDDQYPEPSFAVYRLSEGCWRKSTKGTNNVAGFHWGNYHVKCDCVSTNNGMAYWLLGADGNYFKYHVVSFDFNSEEINTFKLPPHDGGRVSRPRFIFVLDKALAMLVVSRDNLCIWVMGENGRWSKWYSGGLISDMERFFLDNPDGKIFYVNKSCLLIITDQEKLLRYNIKSHKIELVSESIRVTNMFTHVESLLLCKGLESQILTSFPRYYAKFHRLSNIDSCRFLSNEVQLTAAQDDLKKAKKEVGVG